MLLLVVAVVRVSEWEWWWWWGEGWSRLVGWEGGGVTILVGWCRLVARALPRLSVWDLSVRSRTHMKPAAITPTPAGRRQL